MAAIGTQIYSILGIR